MGLRSFGTGIQRVDILKDRFIPVTSAGGGTSITNIGNHPAALLDNVGEWCRLITLVPECYKALPRLIGPIVCSAAAGTAVMNFDVSYDAGWIGGELYNTHTLANALVQMNLTLSELELLDCLAILPGLNPFDMLSLTVAYRGAGGGGNVTNAYVLGFVLWWY